jgi:hypothetical protein
MCGGAVGVREEPTKKPARLALMIAKIATVQNVW